MGLEKRVAPDRDYMESDVTSNPSAQGGIPNVFKEKQTLALP
jgi:hypothetical protein